MRMLVRSLWHSLDRRDGRHGTTQRIWPGFSGRSGLECLEGRNLTAVAWHGAGAELAGNGLVEARNAHHHTRVERQDFPGETADHPGAIAAESAIHASKGKKAKAFSVKQVMNMLPGTWRVDYDASGLFGPGAVGAQVITFVGPRAPLNFSSTSGVVVNGYFGPVSYQFGSWGTWQLLNKETVRLTITGGAPTEYLDRGIIIPGGQTMPVQFLNANQFVTQGQVYNRLG